MKYRPLGSTGIQISEIVFGAGAVGGIVFRPDPETRLEAVRRALGYGINWIDTAPSYGDGQSEENLGWILQELGASPYLSTKVRIGPEHVGDIVGEVQRSMEASLRRLRRDSVDLIQLHTPVTRERGAYRGSITVEDVLGPGGVLEGFQRLRDQGLARLFGFTAFGDTDCLHQLVESGGFQTAQVYYNLLNPTAGRPAPPGFSAHDYRDLIGLCQRRGVGVLNIRVLAAGVIAGNPSPAASIELSPGSSAATDEARARMVWEVLSQDPTDGTPAQQAIRFALMNPGVSGVLVGFSELGHIDEAVAAVDMGPLSDETMRRLEALWDTDFGRLADAGG